MSAVGYFMVAAAASQFIPRYDFIRDYISDYAIGPWGWIYGSAFLASCIGCVALAVALMHAVPKAALSRAGIVLLVVVGLTFAIDFFCPTDILPPGQPPTTLVGTIHLLAAMLGWILFTIGSLLVSSGLERASYWKPWHTLLISLAWVSVILLVLLIIVVVSRWPFAGFVEKLFVLDRDLWMLLVSVLVFNSPAPTADERSRV